MVTLFSSKNIPPQSSICDLLQKESRRHHKTLFAHFVSGVLNTSMRQQEHTNHVLIMFMATMVTTTSLFFAPLLTSFLHANLVGIVEKQKIKQRKREKKENKRVNEWCNSNILSPHVYSGYHGFFYNSLTHN